MPNYRPAPEPIEILRNKSRVMIFVPESTHASPHNDAVVSSLLKWLENVGILCKVVQICAVQDFLSAHICDYAERKLAVSQGKL